MATNYSPKIVTNGLALYLDAANRKSLPDSSAIWYDLSGNANGALVNGPTFSSTNAGSLVFDGVDDTAIIQNSSFAGTTPVSFSVEMIFKGTPPTVLCRNGAGWALGDQSFTLFTILDYSKPYTWNSNQLYHRVSVIDNVTFNEYINNVVQHSFSISSLRSTCTDNKLYASVYLNTNGTIRSYHASNLFVLKIYNRALSPVEIKKNFNALRSRYNL